MRRTLPLTVVVLACAAGPAAAKINLPAPIVSGPAMAGETLTCAQPGGSTPATGYQWLRPLPGHTLGGGGVGFGSALQLLPDQGAIAGATSPEYVAGASDVGRRLQCIIWTVEGDVLGESISAPVAITAAGPNSVSGLPVLLPHRGAEPWLGCSLQITSWTLGRGPWKWTFEWLSAGSIVATEQAAGDAAYSGLPASPRTPGVPLPGHDSADLQGHFAGIPDTVAPYEARYAISEATRYAQFACRVTVSSSAGTVSATSSSTTLDVPPLSPPTERLRLIMFPGLPKDTLAVAVPVTAGARRASVEVTAKQRKRTVVIARGASAVPAGLGTGKAAVLVAAKLNAAGKKLLRQRKNLAVRIVARIDGRKLPIASGRVPVV